MSRADAASASLRSKRAKQAPQDEGAPLKVKVPGSGKQRYTIHDVEVATRTKPAPGKKILARLVVDDDPQKKDLARTIVLARASKHKRARYSGTPPDLAFIREKGQDLAFAKREEISKRYPLGILVAFHVRTGKYVTAQDQKTLIEKYEAKFGDDWGWFARF